MTAQDFPEGTIFIEYRHIYDGWSVAKLPNGEYINRWEPSDRRWLAAQDAIKDLQRSDRIRK